MAEATDDKHPGPNDPNSSLLHRHGRAQGQLGERFLVSGLVVEFIVNGFAWQGARLALAVCCAAHLPLMAMRVAEHDIWLSTGMTERKTSLHRASSVLCRTQIVFSWPIRINTDVC